MHSTRLSDGVQSVSSALDKLISLLGRSDGWVTFVYRHPNSLWPVMQMYDPFILGLDR